MSEELIVNTNGVEIFDSDFDLAISDACAKFGIEDLVKEGQSRWKAVMHFVGKRVFPDTRILKDKNIVYIEGNKIPTNNNRYNYNILNILCDYYIQLSRQYNKLISTVAFSEFVNIDTRIIDEWKNAEPSTTSYRIWKKLQGNREDSLKDKAVDSGNVMGVFQVGRREFQWDMPGVREERERKQVLTAADLPKLGNLDGKNMQNQLIDMQNTTYSDE